MDICAVDLQMNESKSVYSATESRKKATSGNAVVTTKEAYHFKLEAE